MTSTEKSNYVSLHNEFQSLKRKHESLNRDHEQAKLKLEVLEVFPKLVSAANDILRSAVSSSMYPGRVSPGRVSTTGSPAPEGPVRPTSYGENWEQAALKVVTVNPSRFVGDILVARFGKPFLAGHSLSGTKSSHPNAKDKDPKPALPSETIACVRYAMGKRLGTAISDDKIKCLVRFKLNNCTRALCKPLFPSLDVQDASSDTD